MRDEESFILVPCNSGFSSSSFWETPLGFTSLLRVFNSFSELGSEEEEEEEDEEEDDEVDEEEEEHEECAVLLLSGFSESLLSDRSEVMSVFILFRPAFFSSSSPFLRLFTACLAFDLESGQIKKKQRRNYLILTYWLIAFSNYYVYALLMFISETCDLLLVAVKKLKTGDSSKAKLS